jgi:hypothetical protein
MNSKPWAALTSVFFAPVLTWCLSLETVNWAPFLAWTFGIGGDIAIWASSYFRGTGSFAVRNSLNYSLFFFGNLGFFTALLWGKTDGDIEGGVLFALRLPIFLLLAPLFWAGVVFVSGRILMCEGGFRTPRRLWRGLVNWLMGSPPGYRQL